MTARREKQTPFAAGVDKAAAYLESSEGTVDKVVTGVQVVQDKTKPQNLAHIMATKARYIKRCGMVTAGKKSKPRRAEPSMSVLLGWDRENGSTNRPRAPSAPNASNGMAVPDVDKTGFLTETQAQYVYYTKASSVRKPFPTPSAPPRAEDIQPSAEVKRRYSIAAEAAASKASGDDLDLMVAAGNAASHDIASKSKSKIKMSDATRKALARRKKKSRKKRAPKVEGPRAQFFNYGMNNTRGSHNYLKTHNVMPEDPREIYANALHAAVRHPNAEKAAMAIAKAQFLKSHQESVSSAAADLLAALSRDATEAAAAAESAKKTVSLRNQKRKNSQRKSGGDSKEKEVMDVSPHVRTTLISNPPQDPNVNMWDLLRWRDPEAEAKAEEALAARKAAQLKAKEDAVKQKENEKRALEAKKSASRRTKKSSTKRSTAGKSSRKISASKAKALESLSSEELSQFVKFEPQEVKVVDPKAFSNLPAAWTKNIPPAGKKSADRQPSQLDDM